MLDSLKIEETQLDPLPGTEPRFNIWPSDAGTILGLNPYCTPLQLWLEMTGREDKPDFDAMERVRIGKIMEPIIARLYALSEGVKVRRLNRTLIHPKFAWWRGKIDRHVLNQSSRTLLECKNCSEYQRDKWGDSGTDIVPDYYAVQVRAYMPMDLEFEIAHLAVMIGGNAHRVYYLERDQEIENIITNCFVQFHDFCVNDIPPAPLTVSDIEMLWPQNSDDVIVATEDILMDISRIKELTGQLKELNAAKVEIQTRVKMFSREKGYIKDGEDNPVATYKTGTRKGYTVQEKTCRTLRLK